MPSCRVQEWDSHGACPGRHGGGRQSRTRGLDIARPFPSCVDLTRAAQPLQASAYSSVKWGSQQHPPQRLILGSLGHHPPLLARSSVPSRCRPHRHLLHPRPHYAHLALRSHGPEHPVLVSSEPSTGGGEHWGPFPRLPTSPTHISGSWWVGTWLFWKVPVLSTEDSCFSSPIVVQLC